MTQTEDQLDHSLVRGIAWLGGVRWATQIISWGATLLIARLLTPGDYGLFGMAMVYVGLAQIVGETGPTAAIVQRRELTEAELAQLGGVAMLTGMALTLLSIGLAWPIASFYKAPGVRVVVAALAVSFAIRSAGVLPRGLMARDLKFRQLAWIDGVEAMVLMGLTLFGAWRGWGQWALVVSTVASGAVGTAMAVSWRPHHVSWPRRGPGLVGAARYAVHVVLSQLATYAFTNADFAIVGRRLGSAPLGAYSLAWTIASIPVDRVSGLVGRVTPAYFSAVQHDVSALRRYLRSLTEALAMVTLPACIGLALVADRFVPLMLGPRWTEAIQPLRFLSIYAAFRSIVALTPQVLFATDRARLMMQFSVAAAILLPIVFYVGAAWGSAGVAFGWLVGYPIVAVLGFVRPALRAAGLPWREYVKAVVPAVSATAAMGLTVLLERLVVPDAWPNSVHFALDVASGALAYAVVLLGVYRARVVALWSLVKDSFGIANKTTPWYATEPVPANVRLLLISQHFPPDPAVGGLRWQKIARFVAERGWGLDVIALDPANLKTRDDTRLRDLPAGVRVYAVPARRPLLESAVLALWRAATAPAELARALTRAGRPAPAGSASRASAELKWWPREPRDVIRAYAAVVDELRGRLWARAAIRVGNRILQRGVHRAIVTCGPPHLVHLAGRELALQHGLPWAMDLRDPWSLLQRLPEGMASPLWPWLARRHETRAVRDATLVITNTHPLRDAMRGRYPFAASRIIAVPNGHDDDLVPASAPGRRFVVAYAGSIYLDRDPRPLFRAARALIETRALTPETFGLEFMGDVSVLDGQSLAAMARDAGIENFVTLLPTRPRHEALRFLSRAAVLTVMPQDSDMAIPAKLFEYMQFDAWILAFARRGSAIQQLLLGSSADVVEPDDDSAILAALERRFDQFTRGEQATRLADNRRYSRRAQADALLDALADVAHLPRTDAPATEAPVCAA